MQEEEQKPCRVQLLEGTVGEEEILRECRVEQQLGKDWAILASYQRMDGHVRFLEALMLGPA